MFSGSFPWLALSSEDVSSSASTFKEARKAYVKTYTLYLLNAQEFKEYVGVGVLLDCPDKSLLKSP